MEDDSRAHVSCRIHLAVQDLIRHFRLRWSRIHVVGLVSHSEDNWTDFRFIRWLVLCALGSLRTFALRIRLMAEIFAVDRWWILRRHVTKPASTALACFVRRLLDGECRAVGSKAADDRLVDHSQDRLLFTGVAYPLFRTKNWFRSRGTDSPF